MKKCHWLMLLLVLAAPQLFAQTFQCSGTEPFWSVDITHHDIVFKRESATVHLQSVNASHSGNNWVYHTHTLADNKPVTITVHKADCSNGMSDQTFPYQVTYVNNQQTFEGCCERQGYKN